MMNRLETIIQQHPITIHTRRVWIPKGERAISVPFTLHFQGRSLQDKIHTEQTITPVQALTTLFRLADVARFDPQFRRMSQNKQHALQQFLDTLYEPFWQAFSEDQQEEFEQLQAMKQAILAAVPQGDELIFTPGERVRYLGDGGGLREDDWVYCVVLGEIWREGSLLGILVRHEKDGLELTRPPEKLFKEYRWKK
jgi:hypothetical protein